MTGSIGNKNASKLAIHGVKVLGRDSLAATVGYGDRSSQPYRQWSC